MAEDGHNPNAGIRTKTLTDEHVSHVYADPEFIEAIGVVKEMRNRQRVTTEELDEAVSDIARYFAISVADINLYMLPLYIENRERSTTISFDPQSKRFAIGFDLTTTKAELLEEWEQFEQLKATIMPEPLTTTRRRLPEQPDLVYAVFKALKEHTDKEVFELYRSGKLPGYEGSGTQYDTYADLMHYYNRYKRSSDS